MNKSAIIIPILCQLILSCTSPNLPVAVIRKDFHLPVIVQKHLNDTIEYMKVDFLNGIYFKFAGKYKFTDTLFLDKDFIHGDTSPEADIVRERSRPERKDSLTTDGFQVFPDYKTSIYYKEPYYSNTFCYFPVYVVNETSTTKIFFGKDSHVFGIQEAVDVTDYWDNWRPIEARGFDFCGNGYFGIKVHPGEFVMFLVPKYQGEEKNIMRIRLEIGESLYISGPYVGTFNAKQFEILKTTYIYRCIKDPKNRLPFDLFYGAIPKGYDPY